MVKFTFNSRESIKYIIIAILFVFIISEILRKDTVEGFRRRRGGRSICPSGQRSTRVLKSTEEPCSTLTEKIFLWIIPKVRKRPLCGLFKSKMKCV